MKAGIKKLKRSLTFWDGASLIVANVIGIGIFTTPGIVAGMVPDSGSFLLVWLAGGLIALIGATAYTELAVKMPRAGGEYLYLRETFGPLWGFLSGWTSFIAGFPGAIAAAAIGFSAYLETILPAGISESTAFEFIPASLVMLPFRETIAISIILLITFFHILKIDIGKRIQNLLTGLSVGTILALIVAGLVYSNGYSLTFRPATLFDTADVWLIALIPVMFTYSGWNAAVYVAEEMKNPGKNMFRSMLTGTIVVVILYLLLNFVFVKSLTIDTLAGNIDVANLLTNRALGDNGQILIAIVIMAALVSGISAMIIAGPRVYFAMARDGYFFNRLARINPEQETPVYSIFAQSTWCILLILTGTFEELLTYTGFAIVLFSTLSVISLLVLKRGEESHNLLRNCLYLVFIASGLAMTVNAIIRSPMPSTAGLAMIGLGIPVYYWFRYKNI